MRSNLRFLSKIRVRVVREQFLALFSGNAMEKTGRQGYLPRFTTHKEAVGML